MNIVLITIDCWRWDRLGFHSGKTYLTPRIDSLAEQGVVFSQAVTASNSTDTSIASILTSTFPETHGVYQNAVKFDSDEIPTIAEVLAGAGLETAAAVGVEHLSSYFGLGRGFDRFYNNSSLDGLYYHICNKEIMGLNLIRVLLFIRYRLKLFTTHWRAAQYVNRDILRWLAKNYFQRFFVWLHYFDAHEYKNEREYNEKIRYVDRCVGELVNFLAQKGVKDQTLFVILGDHGESFGEHGVGSHTYTIYDEIMRVPLIFSHPQLGPDRINGMVRTVDIAPTILDLLDLPIPENWAGISLKPLFTNPEAQSHLAALCYSNTSHLTAKCIRTKKWKYIFNSNGEDELYDLENDKNELRNCIHEDPEILTKLKALFFDLENLSKRRYLEKRDENENIQAMLKSLGYLD